MDITETTKEYIIDAQSKRLGKVATQAASFLIGKDRVDFARHTVAPVKVKIINASKLDITEKRKGETYDTYSGYPGGRRVETLGHLADRRGFSEVIRRTVAGMLPKNKLQKPTMANLEVSE